jgi:hypothetical protein
MNDKFPGEVELTTYDNGRIELDISLDQYNVWNQSVMRLRGLSLSALAETDPGKTYALIRRMVGNLALHAEYLSIDGKLLADDKIDGREATYLMGKRILTDRMPEILDNAIEFSLGITQKEEDALMFGTEGIRLSLIDIVVEPPDYAF